MRTTRSIAFNNTREDGFTLTELLVVIVTVAILALLLLPALAGTKPNSQAFQCLENLRQLTLGWQMYAEDNNSKLAPNGGQANSGPPPTDPSYRSGGANFQWCPGTMNAFSLFATNYVQAGCIYHYVKTMNVYKCPADQSFFKFGLNIYPKVRSYSMNCYLSPILHNEWTSVGTRNFYKDTDITRPGPSMTYVLIDENEYSINDAFFVSDPTMVNWLSLIHISMLNLSQAFAKSFPDFFDHCDKTSSVMSSGKAGDRTANNRGLVPRGSFGSGDT